MAKALMGHHGAPGSAQLLHEAALLRRRVADLQDQVARLTEENERLSALHTRDLDAELAGELTGELSNA